MSVNTRVSVDRYKWLIGVYARVHLCKGVLLRAGWCVNLGEGLCVCLLVLIRVGAWRGCVPMCSTVYIWMRVCACTNGFACG